MMKNRSLKLVGMFVDLSMVTHFWQFAAEKNMSITIGERVREISGPKLFYLHAQIPADER